MEKEIRIVEGSTRNLIVEHVSLIDAFKFMVDNSIQAYKKKYNTIDGCRIKINIKNNKLEIIDNAGGINDDKTYKRLFSMEEGLGLKKAYYKLADKVILKSNNENKSFKAILDYKYLNIESMKYKYEEIEFNEELESGFSIEIEKINKKVKNRLLKEKFQLALKESLVSSYRIFIDKGLSIEINNEKIGKFEVGVFLRKIDIDGGYINIYKTHDIDKSKKNGIDLFVNDWLILDRKKDKESGWKKLITTGYTFVDRVIEIVYESSNEETIENILQSMNDKFLINVRENLDLFSKETVGISFDTNKKIATEMLNHFNMQNYKALGEHAFTRLINEFRDDNLDERDLIEKLKRICKVSTDRELRKIAYNLLNDICIRCDKIDALKEIYSCNDVIEILDYLYENI